MKWSRDRTVVVIVTVLIVLLFVGTYYNVRELSLSTLACKEGVTIEEMLNHPADRYWVHVTCWNCKGRVSYEPLRGQSIEACLWWKECLWCGVVNSNDRHGD